MNIELQSTLTLGQNIHVIALSGGPCSGKTTGLAKLHKKLTDRGYKVLIAPETATKMIGGGVHPWEVDPITFQRQILLDTLMQEERFMEAAQAYRDMGHKVVLLCDRGAMDGQGYVKDEEFYGLCKKLAISLHAICNLRYHAVIFMRTAVLGAEAFYTLENNSARKESMEVARALDQKTLEAWQRHHHLRVIDNSTDFDGKIDKLLMEVFAAIGDPLPIEREEKFLIKDFDPKVIPGRIVTTRIVQDYLLPANTHCRRTGCRSCKIPCFKPETACKRRKMTSLLPHESQGERRVRMRSDDSGVSYFYTVKYEIRKGERFESERAISKSEYERLLLVRDPALRTIEKTRLNFLYESQVVEVDLYKGTVGGKRDKGNLVTMEIELNPHQVKPLLPPFVRVLKNVTGVKEYSNRALAERKN